MLIEERVEQGRPRAPDAQNKKRTQGLGGGYHAIVEILNYSRRDLSVLDISGKPYPIPNDGAAA